MKIISSVAEMQKLAARLHKNNKKIGFVPTMGFLHDGHLRLVDEAKKKSDVVIVSIFVNPTQFGKNEDLSRYPRDEKGDLKKLRTLGVDFAFLPTAKQMYPEEPQVKISVGVLAERLCGKSRPGHFDGVATVVLKLFNIVQPDVAVFGKKDFQQFRVIQKLVQDFNLSIKIVGVATEREEDGLALSSRNFYLSPAERKEALCLSRGLNTVRQACQKKVLSSSEMRKIFLNGFSKKMQLDYLEVCDAIHLKPIAKYQKGQTLIAVAAFVGTTRLIDNITL